MASAAESGDMASAARSGGNRASRVFVDITPLRVSRDYRLLFFGQMVSWLGRQLTLVAVPIQVYDLTGSSLAVGLLGRGRPGPLLRVSLAGRGVADAGARPT